MSVNEASFTTRPSTPKAFCHPAGSTNDIDASTFCVVTSNARVRSSVGACDAPLIPLTVSAVLAPTDTVSPDMSFSMSKESEVALMLDPPPGRSNAPGIEIPALKKPVDGLNWI